MRVFQLYAKSPVDRDGGDSGRLEMTDLRFTPSSPRSAASTNHLRWRHDGSHWTLAVTRREGDCSGRVSRLCAHAAGKRNLAITWHACPVSNARYIFPDAFRCSGFFMMMLCRKLHKAKLTLPKPSTSN